MINSTKRYLAKAEYRIQLDELFTQETSKLLTRLDDVEFAPQGPWDQASFRGRVRRYESVTEPLARMVGVMGRWGNGNEISVVLDIIRSLYRHAESVGNGLSVYLAVRSYPAVLVFTAYGLGLVRAERWGALHQLFSGVIAREYKEPVRAVECLFLWGWKGGPDDTWKQMEGLEQRKTPLSDHLLELFLQWSKSFVGLAPDFELLFGRYELLGSLAVLERNEKEGLKAELSGDPAQCWAWMPVGRAGWHRENAEKLAAEIQSDLMKSELTKAGFAKADPEYLEMFVDNFKLVGARHILLS